MEEALARAEYAAYRHAQRHAQLTADVSREPVARKRPKETALGTAHPGLHTASNTSSGFLKKLLLKGRQT